ncbi:sensor domain-containing diguanylate cyclase [Vibrio cholerae]|nr:sensor domain-containing diguanylate cyclase [Vibrio cholerae]EID0159833.1 sensor domain-containing diguanylate cyclase [Vibrio cholerae]EJL6349381.1 sensor domain-containing diguanylate cyclase [Vibrio cholerae]EJL6984712.1 sensor domain-containing diguanylate cyclase [Vibrio cholerae]EJR0942304.1 sensor domain-containing diguanylate cyclase [Vibrio cholerae]
MDHRFSTKLFLFLMIAWPLLFGSMSEAVECQTLTIANSKAWKPYSYLDEQGQPSGILIDFWLAFGEANHVDIQFQLMDWNDSLEAVKLGKSDVQAGLIRSASRLAYLDFAEPLLTIDTQLYVHRTLLGDKLDTLLSGAMNVSLGVVKGGFEQEFMQREYPQLKLIEYANNELMMSAAKRRELDGFVADTQVAKGNRDLLEQIEQGFAQLSSNEKNRILSRWVHIETIYPRYLMPILASGLLLSIVIYTLQLRRTVRLRTQQLEEANQKLSYLAKTDSLTDIANRRSFFEYLEAEQTRSGSLTLMVFDIDDFKTINDRFGHGAGDNAICFVVGCVRQALASDTYFARIGGEEFAIVARGKNAEESQQLAERICQRVAEKKWVVNAQHSLSLTISLGCAFYLHPARPFSLHDADSLMYEGKRNGKNQVVFRTWS